MTDYLSQLESIAIAPIRLHGNIARTACPVHGGHNTSTFVYWVDTGRCFCHGCSFTGSIVDAAMKSKDMTQTEALQYLDLKDIPKNDYEIHVRDKSNIDFTQENNYFLSCAKDRAKELFDELINPIALSGMDLSLLYGLIGYDNVNDTLTVAIKDNDRVVQIKRRKVADVKWKSMHDSDGSYAPHRITGKSVVYIVSGIAEYIILQASGLDYIAMQSDTAKISFDLSDKMVVIFEDNDTKEAPKETPEYLRDALDSNMANHFKLKVTKNINAKKIIPIDFQNMLDMNLAYGYDLKDFVNNYPENWKELVTSEIEYFAKEELC